MKLSRIKRTATIKSLLGLTQEEMAMLLGVSRVQWAMFEIGQRGLPLVAIQRLNPLLSNANKPESVSKESPTIIEAEKKKAQEWLKREYLKVQIKQQLLERKINAMEKTRSECFSALETVHYLESHPEKELIPDMASFIKIRVLNTLNKNALHRLQEMQLKKESLDILKNSLEQKMKENENDSSNDSFI